MVSKVMMMKTKWYPRPHNFNVSWGFGLESGVSNQTTIIPLTMYDEGLGDPSAYTANPLNATFAEVAMPNCFPESRINLIESRLTISLSKGALETDKVPAIRYAYMPIFVTFDDIIALDEVSTLDISEVLELQREATDRQCYPLFNAVDMPPGVKTTVDTLHANVPGLT